MSNQLIREYPYDKPKYTHEEMLRMLQVRARAIINLIDKEKPDVLFCIPPGAMGSMLLYHIAKKQGVKTLNIAPTNLRNRFILSEDYTTFTSVDARFRTQIAELKCSRAWQQALDFLDEFRKKPIPYFEKTTPEHQPVTRVKQLKFLNPVNALRSLGVFIQSVLRHYQTNERHDYTYIGPWNYLKDLLKRKSRNLIGLEDLYDTFNPKEDFAFFPLHYEPELSLLLLAPYYTDQISLIRQIARSLPVHIKLVVKEHPVMAEYRPRSFYKALKKIPNVKIISPTISSFEVIPNAKLIFTITGTVGWEAVLLKKPVISFGHQSFNALTSVVTFCKEIERLPFIILEKIHDFDYNEEEVVAYIAALLEESATLNLNSLWTEETDQQKRKDGVKPLADLLAQTIKIKC
jgi:hypothetical protein